MAFVSERIEKEEDKVYFNTLGFTDMFQAPLRPYWWAIDRERKIILVPRGGGSFDVPIGYALYLEGEIIEIEGNMSEEGSRRAGKVKIEWYIEKIKVSKTLIQKGYNVDQVMEIIKDAFYGLGDSGIERNKITEVNIKILSELELL